LRRKFTGLVTFFVKQGGLALLGRVQLGQTKLRQAQAKLQLMVPKVQAPRPAQRLALDESILPVRR